MVCKEKTTFAVAECGLGDTVHIRVNVDLKR